MDEIALYTYLKGLMPDGMQFVLPYLDKNPLPKPGTDWAQMNILGIEDIAWSQERQISSDIIDGIVSVAYDQNRIYRIQFDFYGPEALKNASVFKHNLQVNLNGDKTAPVNLKKMSGIRNLTFLAENKAWKKRYSFDVELFAVDTIEQDHWFIKTADVSIVNRGNNFKKEK